MKDFFKELYMNGFRRNYWFFAHFLIPLLFSHVYLRYSDNVLFLFFLVLFIAVGWEIYEYETDDIVKIYGSKRRFLFDSLGDVLAAISAFLISLI